MSDLFTLPNGPWSIALCAILGAIIGSYLATIALRWPEGRNASTGRSQCDGCDAALRWFELIPILSSIMARGRCRRCAALIARLHFGVELGAAILGSVAAAITPTLGMALIIALLFWQLLLLAVLDHRHLWLPDRLTLVLAASGLALAGLLTDVALLSRIVGMVGGFASLELVRRTFLHLRGIEGMGAGDPKLLGAIAAWSGPLALPFILAAAAALGLLIALAKIAKGTPMTAFPFGTYLAIATVGYMAMRA